MERAGNFGNDGMRNGCVHFLVCNSLKRLFRFIFG